METRCRRCAKGWPRFARRTCRPPRTSSAAWSRRSAELGPLFERDKSGLLGVALTSTGAATPQPGTRRRPGDRLEPVLGRPGKPFPRRAGQGPDLECRRSAENHAALGEERLAASGSRPRQAGLAVADLEAGWSYQGS
ncbi:hypothetical protein ACPA9J_36375 [Pseudomonas aeruginosa]